MTKTRSEGIIMKTLTITTLLLATALCGCSNEKLPATFQATGKSTIGGQNIYTARDTGTGCEIVITPNGVIARNERAADGTTIKQRCVTTGDEQAAPTVVTTTTGVPAQAAFAPAERPASQADVVRAAQDAVRAQQQAIPPASAPVIPPPKGAQRTQPATPADDGDGVESQLK